MSEKETVRTKNIVLIMMGIVLSLAGIVYIVSQYSKLLSQILTAEDNNPSDERFDKKLKNRFLQIHNDEETLSPEAENDDLSLDIEE